METEKQVSSLLRVMFRVNYTTILVIRFLIAENVIISTQRLKDHIGITLKLPSFLRITSPTSHCSQLNILYITSDINISDRSLFHYSF